MRTFTKEELEQLKEAEQYFHSAVYAQYKRATSTKLDTLLYNIWSNVSGDSSKVNFSCGVCSYKFYLKVGTKYYEDLAIVGKELEPKDVTTSESVKSKRTYNKKATNKKQNG